MNLRLLLSCLVLAWFTTPLRAQLKPYDNSFNQTGYSLVSIDTTDDQCMDMCTMKNGNIVLCGWTKQNWLYQGALTRMLPNGKTDSSFGNNGRVVVAAGTYETHFNRVRVMPNGNIIAVGERTFPNNDYSELIIMGFTSTGKIDSSFGTNGITYMGGANYSGTGINFQTDGKILVSGYGIMNYQGTYGFFIRLNGNGVYDASFNGGGFQYITPLFSQGVGGYTIANIVQDPAGKIVGVGGASVFNSTANVVVKLKSNGTGDPAYASNGLNMYQYNNGMQVALDICFLANNKQLVLAYEPTYPASYLLGFHNADGSINTSLGTNGLVRMQRPEDVFCKRLALHPSGDMYIAGFSRKVAGNSATVCIIDTTGHTDSTWAANGMFNDYIGTNATSSNAVTTAIDSNGKILVAGTTTINGKGQFYVARLIAPNRHLQVTATNKSNMPDWSFYPNPVRNALQITINLQQLMPLHLSITDATGKLVCEKTVEQKSTGSIVVPFTMPTEIAAGMYLLKMKAGSRSSAKWFEYKKY